MIDRNDLIEVGEIFKPHGIKGEVSLSLDYGLTPADLRCMILDMDGIPVPFFTRAARPRGADSWLVTFEGIDTDTAAATISRRPVMALRSDLPEGCGEPDGEGVNLYDLVGYTLCDADGNPVGTIDTIDDSTANVLFHVTTAGGGNTVYIPFAEELVTDLDIEGRRISLDIPQGLLDLN